MLPDPQSVALLVVSEAQSGALAFNLGITLRGSRFSFTLAMALGSVIGLLMGRFRAADSIGDPWLVVLLNLRAGHHRAGLCVGRPDRNRRIAAVALNKLPIAMVTVREGARSLDRGLDEMAKVFRMSAWHKFAMSCCRSLPLLAAAARSGLSLVWKIVLIVELLGRPNGVGFEIGTAFQLFDVTGSSPMLSPSSP